MARPTQSLCLLTVFATVFASLQICCIRSARGAIFETLSDDIRNNVRLSWRASSGGVVSTATRLKDVARRLQSSLCSHPFYGSSTGRTKRYERTFAVLISQHSRASTLMMKVPGCNVEVPSDWCADGAHARLVKDIELEEASDEHDSISINALVLWFPLWHATTATLQYFLVYDAMEVFREQVVQACVAPLQQELGEDRWPWQPFALYPRFEQCIRDEVEEQGTLHSYAQVVAVGKEFHGGFSAPRGGLVVESTRIGDAVMLPTIFEGPGI